MAKHFFLLTLLLVFPSPVLADPPHVHNSDTPQAGLQVIHLQGEVVRQ